jgi:hypothetical protein
VETTLMSVAWTTGPRTSSEASRMMPAVDLPLPSRRCWRMRRTMFSTSMMASSTSSPRAITSPARIMVLMVTPARLSTVPAATSDRGMVTALMKATRHSRMKKLRMSTTSRKPSSMALPRLLIAVWMKVAGRKMEVSTSIPVRPGRISASAASTPRVTSRVLPQGSFSTISMSPTPSLMTASPLRWGWLPRTTVATSPSATGLVPFGASMGIWASSRGLMRGRMWRIPSRWLGVSMNPPVPISRPLENFSMPTSRVSAVASMTRFRETPRWSIRRGSAWTWSTDQRSPQMATLATPGTRISRGRTVQ